MIAEYQVTYLQNLNDEEIPCKLIFENIQDNINLMKIISDDDEYTYFYKIIGNNFINKTFNDEINECIITYNYDYKEIKSKILFDSNSDSAYNEFKNNLISLMNTKLESINYENGNLKYIGKVLRINNKSIFNGEGKLYYNSSKHIIKYKGEFEDNLFDGKGIFYSKDNKIILHANNISNGIPVQKGKLVLKYKDKNDSIYFDFDEKFWYNFADLIQSEKNEKRDLVLSDEFTILLAKYLYPNVDFDSLIFNEKSIKEQRTIIYKKIKNIELDNKKILKIRNDLQYHHNLTCVILIVSIIFNFLRIIY